mmetsp:Transcript_37365/g.116822  ORF Transcript_37365/g.116822 Transcript_37365/m.116822 type:complete len:337 (+) Transcript_37365:747-1757(+)
MGGHVNAMTRLGNLCVDNVGDDLSGGSANIGAAVDWYVRAAAAPAPSSDAMYNLAKLYRDGFQAQVSNTGEVQELVPQDSRRARFWLSRAGERGDADAALWLAHAARDGDAALGFDAPDRDACLAWLRKAMDMDAPGVWFYAAQLYRFGDPDIGMAPEEDKFWAYAERGAQGGDADALWALADAYMIGTPLRPRSPRKALALYERACDAGSGESALCLGALFFNGEAGVPQDYKARPTLTLTLTSTPILTQNPDPSPSPKPNPTTGGVPLLRARSGAWYPHRVAQPCLYARGGAGRAAGFGRRGPHLRDLGAAHPRLARRADEVRLRLGVRLRVFA